MKLKNIFLGFFFVCSQSIFSVFDPIIGSTIGGVGIAPFIGSAVVTSVYGLCRASYSTEKASHCISRRADIASYEVKVTYFEQDEMVDVFLVSAHYFDELKEKIAHLLEHVVSNSKKPRVLIQGELFLKDGSSVRINDFSVKKRRTDKKRVAYMRRVVNRVDRHFYVSSYPSYPLAGFFTKTLIFFSNPYAFVLGTAFVW